jgi:outer membrane protein OmpA-like peptidoglycan-associated protein
MTAMREKYPGGKAVSVSIGGQKTLELPPRVFRGRLTGMLFDRDKTFLLPSALRGITELARYYDEHPGLHVLVVGHTDATGDAAYNVKLAEARARSLEAFLTDDVDAWLGSYRAGQPAGKAWGAIEDQHMLTALAGYDGNIDGKLGRESKAAVKRFQAGEGIAQTGDLDAATRRALVTKYLATDSTTLPAGTPVTVHGAGPHHPEDDGDDEESRRRNRRVEIFLSEGPIDPAPGAPDGPERDEWVARSSETVDFATAPEDLVELEIGWGTELVERLPDDFVLTLSGEGVTPLAKRKREAAHRDGLALFAFRFIDASKALTLEASGGGKRVTLWQEQRPGTFEADVEWVGAIDELVGEAAETAPNDPPLHAGRFPDDVRVDLRGVV